MKKLLGVMLVLSMFAGVTHAQFTAGTKSVGGTISYYMDMTEDADLSIITLAPSGGYFVADNLEIIASLGYTKWTDSDAMMSFGGGAKYFMNNIYAGGLFGYSKFGDADGVTDLLFEGGYLFPLTDFFFVDIGADYYMGMGDNESKYLQFGIGFATFF